MAIFMTEKKYRQELEKAKKKNVEKEYKREIRKEKMKYHTVRKVETSKLFAAYLFALMNTIIVYAMFAMWKFEDFSYLGVLITDIAAQILVYGIYCLKAYKGKNAEEEMKFKRETMALDTDNADADDGVG
jgi:hypothetical protein